MAVNAKLSVLPSFQPRRVKIPMSGVISCSRFDTGPVFQRSGAPRRDHVRRACRPCQAQRFRVGSGVGAIRISEKTNRTGMLPNGVTPFDFGGLAVIAEQHPVELRAIGDSRLRRNAVAERPVRRVELLHDSPGVAARIGRIIPGAVVHHAPGHELRARIVRIGVVVEIIGDGEAPGIDGIARQRPIAAELIRVAFDVLLFRAEAEIVLDEQPGDVGLGSRAGYARNLSIGRIGDAVDAAESFSAGDLRIEHKYGVLFEPHAEEQSGCERDIVLGIILPG